MSKVFYLLVLLLFFLQSSCGSWDQVKRGLTGQKKGSTDEFLVKKKDPLVQPPHYGELPNPDESNQLYEEESDTDDELSIKSLETDNESNSSTSTVEKNISRRLKKN